MAEAVPEADIDSVIERLLEGRMLKGNLLFVTTRLSSYASAWLSTWEASSAH